MPAPKFDPDSDLDESGLTVRMNTHGDRELVCPSCGGWLRTHTSDGVRVYKAQSEVFRQVNHVVPCEAVNKMLTHFLNNPLKVSHDQGSHL